MSKLLSKLIERVTDRLDLNIVRKSTQFDFPQLYFLQRYLEANAIDCVIDVGANVGQYAKLLRDIGYRGWILSVEPDPACFAKLEEATTGDEKWHSFNMALGQKSGVETFNIMSSALFNSFREPSHKHTSLYAEMNQVVERVPVKTIRLDEVLPQWKRELAFDRPYLKMDTQGYDLEVFRGAARVHNALVAIQGELSVKGIYDDIPDWREALSEYEAAGFRLVGLFQVNPGSRDFVELDCHMANPRLTGTLRW